jgi:hypothetical protein
MAEGQSREAWQHTSSLLAMLINANPFRSKGAKIAQPHQFDPYHRKPAADKPLKAPLWALKVFAPECKIKRS